MVDDVLLLANPLERYSVHVGKPFARPCGAPVRSTPTGGSSSTSMAVDPAGPYRQPGLLMRDEHDLGRVLDALLTNALVHTATGTPVRVATRRTPEHALI